MNTVCLVQIINNENGQNFLSPNIIGVKIYGFFLFKCNTLKWYVPLNSSILLQQNGK